MKKKITGIFMTLTAVCMLASGQTTTNEWDFFTPPAVGDWFNPSYWQEGFVPIPGSHAFNSTPKTIFLDAPATVFQFTTRNFNNNNFDLASNGVLNISTDMGINDISEYGLLAGTFSVNGGTLNVSNNLYVAGRRGTNIVLRGQGSGELVVNSGYVNVTNNLQVGTGGQGSGVDGIVTMNAGTVTVVNATILGGGDLATDSGTLDIFGGVYNESPSSSANALQIGVGGPGDGAVNLYGGQLFNNHGLEMETGEANDAGTASITLAGGEWWQESPAVSIEDESSFHFSGGVFYWTGDNVATFSSLVSNSQVTWDQGLTNMLTLSWDASWTNAFTLDYGYWSKAYSSVLYADYNDAVSGYTAVWSFDETPAAEPPVSDTLPELYTFSNVSGDQLWSTAGNWNLFAVPTSEDSVECISTNAAVIDGTAAADNLTIGSEFGTGTLAVVQFGTLSATNVVIGSNFGTNSVGKLLVDGGDVDIANTLRLPEFGETRTGELQINSGTVTVNGRTTVGGIIGSTNNLGTMVINGGLFEQADDRLIIGDGGNGIVTVNGGELKVTTNPADWFNPLNIANFNYGDGTLIINDGWVEAPGLLMGVSSSIGTGSIYLNGGTLRFFGGFPEAIQIGTNAKIYLDQGVLRQPTNTGGNLFGFLFTEKIVANGGRETMLFPTFDYSWADGDSTIYIKYDDETKETYVWAYKPPEVPEVPPVLSIAEGAAGTVSVTAVDLGAAFTYELQSKDSLTDPSWSSVGTTSGVTESTWSVPATNSAQFYQVESVLP